MQEIVVKCREHKARRVDGFGYTSVNSRIPCILHQQLRVWAAEQEISVQLAVERAIRLLIAEPEPETPFEDA
jgi:predicted HicB family RNase H-like nuclease